MNYVALGDSYASGVGLPPALAYPVLLRTGATPGSPGSPAASSGAVTGDVVGSQVGALREATGRHPDRRGERRRLRLGPRGLPALARPAAAGGPRPGRLRWRRRLGPRPSSRSRFSAARPRCRGAGRSRWSGCCPTSPAARPTRRSW